MNWWLLIEIHFVNKNVLLNSFVQNGDSTPYRRSKFVKYAKNQFSRKDAHHSFCPGKEPYTLDYHIRFGYLSLVRLGPVGAGQCETLIRQKDSPRHRSPIELYTTQALIPGRVIILETQCLRELRTLTYLLKQYKVHGKTKSRRKLEAFLV